jgi:hypothetical protein
MKDPDQQQYVVSARLGGIAFDQASQKEQDEKNKRVPEPGMHAYVRVVRRTSCAVRRAPCNGVMLFFSTN